MKFVQTQPVVDPDHAIRDLALGFALSAAVTAGMIGAALGFGYVSAKIQERRDRKHLSLVETETE